MVFTEKYAITANLLLNKLSEKLLLWNPMLLYTSITVHVTGLVL
jgi:hypothetical protein